MKALIYILFIIIFAFAACKAIQLADILRLSPGMTSREVNYIMGNPVRILSSSFTQEGQIEVFEYRTFRNESYAVEFLNGRLRRYDFMHDNVPSTTIREPIPGHPVRPILPIRPRPFVSPTPDNRVDSTRIGTE